MNQHKLEAQNQWNTTPCGSGDYLSGIEYGSYTFFEQVRRNRYGVSDQWIKETINFKMANGKRLLEIGYGMGTDLLTFCEEGVEVYGVDFTEEHYHLAQKNFQLHEKQAMLKLCDAENIDFPSNFFDFVYSNGVLHHTPDTVRCISEAYRVLKPGGQFIMSLYYTYSAFHIFSKIFYDGLFKGKLRKLGYKGLMSTVEHGADGINIKPLVKTFSKKQLRHILSDFSKVDFKIAHFKRDHIPKFGKLIPKFTERLLSQYLGWYIVTFATK